MPRFQVTVGWVPYLCYSTFSEALAVAERIRSFTAFGPVGVRAL